MLLTEAAKRFTSLFRLVHCLLQLIVPPSPRRLCYTSFPDYSDNSYFIYRHALLERKNLVHIWLLIDMHAAPTIRRDFIEFGGKERGHSLHIAKHGSLHGYWLYLRSQYVFHTHGTYRFAHWTFRREVVSLWHGMPIKRIAHLDLAIPNQSVAFGTRHIASSYFYKYIIACAFKVPSEIVSVCGLPRCDALRSDYVAQKDRDDIFSILDIPKNKKFILWMPTFRTEVSSTASPQSFFDDLSQETLQTFDHLCSVYSCVVVIKLHPSDPLNHSNVDFDYKNLRLEKAEKWLGYEIPLYEVIAASDALISDVSSVLIDYLVTGRPIGVLGFDPTTYARGLAFPIDLLFRSGRFNVLSDETSINSFFERIGEKTTRHDRNNMVSMFYDTFAEKSAESMLTQIGLRA